MICLACIIETPKTWRAPSVEDFGSCEKRFGFWSFDLSLDPIMSFTGPKWFRCTLLISIASALVSASNVPEALVDDECEGECSLEMLHLRAKKIVQAEVSEGKMGMMGRMVSGIDEPTT